MDITALHLQFEKLGWEGVALFAGAVEQKGCGGVFMAFMRHKYAISMEDFAGSNKLYTVQHYLSDLLSRKGLLTEEQVKWIYQVLGLYSGSCRHTRQGPD